ncbi:hypothetical protein [Nostoc sp. C057]
MLFLFTLTRRYANSFAVDSCNDGSFTYPLAEVLSSGSGDANAIAYGRS